MRIGLDGFNLAMPRGTGVATYGRVLSHAIAGLGHTVDVVYGTTVPAASADLLREVQFFDALDREGGRKPPVPGTPRWLREAAQRIAGPTLAAGVPITGRVEARGFAARMPAFDRVLNATDLFDRAERYFRRWGRFLRLRVPEPVPDIMHWTYPIPILLEGARNIYTLHDLVPLRLPYTTLDNKRLYLRLLRGCIRWGDQVCTVSESSRRDIVEILGVAPGRVTNTFQSSRMADAPVETAGGGLDAWLDGLFRLRTGGYLLYFGALEPKKNVGRLIEAYLSSGLAMPLVIVGGRAWKSESELRLIQPGASALRDTNRSGRVQQLEYVPASWLSALIRGARAVVFPSLYEGFGLPVLEAMQAGTPVLTSTESSLPEVGGDAALLVDPYDTAAIADALRRLATDDALCARLATAGPSQAERFAPAHYQARLQAMYDGVMGRPAGSAPQSA